MKKLSNTEAELKKNIAYKKSVQSNAFIADFKHVIKGVFRIQSNISDGTFCEKLHFRLVPNTSLCIDLLGTFPEAATGHVL